MSRTFVSAFCSFLFADVRIFGFTIDFVLYSAYNNGRQSIEQVFVMGLLRAAYRGVKIFANQLSRRAHRHPPTPSGSAQYQRVAGWTEQGRVGLNASEHQSSCKIARVNVHKQPQTA